jgi:hypothetical protein
MSVEYDIVDNAECYVLFITKQVVGRGIQRGVVASIYVEDRNAYGRRNEMTEIVDDDLGTGNLKKVTGIRCSHAHSSEVP